MSRGPLHSNKSHSSIASIQFCWEDFRIEDDTAGLSSLHLPFWSRGEHAKNYEDGKELFKYTLLQHIDIPDLQEVWPELIEAFRSIKDKRGIWKVWTSKERIGLGVQSSQ